MRVSNEGSCSAKVGRLKPGRTGRALSAWTQSSRLPLNQHHRRVNPAMDMFLRVLNGAIFWHISHKGGTD